MDNMRYRDGNVYLYKRKLSNKYQARLKLPNGKWKRISTGESDLKLASEIACAEYDEIKVLDKHHISVDSRRFHDVAKLAIKEMEEELALGYGKQSYVDYISAIKNYHMPYFKNTFINNIDANKLNEFDDWRNKKVGRRLKHSTLNNHNSGLRRVFKVALDRDWMHSYQVPEIKNKGKKTERRPYFTTEEYTQLYRFMRKWCKGGRTKKSQMMRELLRDYVLILANTGMRHGTESLTLTWGKIEEFEQDGIKYLKFWVNGKTGEHEMIAKHGVRRYLERIKSRFESVSDNDYVFRLRDGTLTKHLDGTFEQCLHDSNLTFDGHDKRRTLYSIRHTYATMQILLNKIDLHTLAVQMHTSIAMLEKHYSHLTPTLRAKELAGRQFVKKILE